MVKATIWITKSKSKITTNNYWNRTVKKNNKPMIIGVKVKYHTLGLQSST